MTTKIRPILGYTLPALLSLHLTSCFSANHGSITSGTKSKEQALMLDAATVPIQAVILPPAYVAHKIDKSKKKSQKKQQEYYHNMLMSNPSAITSDHWPYDSSPKSKALRGMLWKNEGNFSERDLTLLIKRKPDWRSDVYNHSNCTKQILIEGYEAYVKQANRTPLTSAFRDILRHPKTPASYVVEVSNWNNLTELDEYYITRILKVKPRN